MTPSLVLASQSRRGFLHSSVGIVAAPSLVGSALAQSAAPPVPRSVSGRPVPKMEKEMGEPLARRVGWAVVGLGQFALNQIIPAFAESKSSKLVALVSGNRSKAESVADRYGVDRKAIYDYPVFDHIRDNPEIQVIYIILPNALHAEFAVRASRAGKHVMCEKPMANTPAECDEMIAAAKAAGRKLMIGYRAHFEPHNVKAMAMARGGELGTIRLVTSDHHRHIDPSVPADQWRLDKALAGGGSLVDIGIYSLQAARYMTGEEPVAVAAQISTPADDPRFAQVEDLVSFQLRFPSGAQAHLSSSYTAQNVKRIQAFGTKASAILDPATEYEGNRLTLRSETGSDEVKVEPLNQFAAEIDHLSECVRTGQDPRTPGEEGLRDIRLIKAIYAAAEARQWLKLDGDGRHAG